MQITSIDFQNNTFTLKDGENTYKGAYCHLGDGKLAIDHNTSLSGSQSISLRDRLELLVNGNKDSLF